MSLKNSRDPGRCSAFTYIPTLHTLKGQFRVCLFCISNHMVPVTFRTPFYSWLIWICWINGVLWCRASLLLGPSIGTMWQLNVLFFFLQIWSQFSSGYWLMGWDHMTVGKIPVECLVICQFSFLKLAGLCSCHSSHQWILSQVLNPRCLRPLVW